jgi:DnaJ domain
MSTDFHEILGVSPSATPEEIKAAYHRKLREFPAHSHPQEFKAIREAYEILRKTSSGKPEPFLKFRPVTATISDSDRDALKQLIEKNIILSLNAVLKQTF